MSSIVETEPTWSKDIIHNDNAGTDGGNEIFEGGKRANTR